MTRRALKKTHIYNHTENVKLKFAHVNFSK